MAETNNSSDQSPTKEPPPYDYYNPSTWMVESPESEEVVNEEQAAITDGIFAKLSAQMEKIDQEDALKQKEAQDEANEIEREKESGESLNNRVLQKPTSHRNAQRVLQRGSHSRDQSQYVCEDD